jgi:hypothetical protein
MKKSFHLVFEFHSGVYFNASVLCYKELGCLGSIALGYGLDERGFDP